MPIFKMSLYEKEKHSSKSSALVFSTHDFRPIYNTVAKQVVWKACWKIPSGSLRKEERMKNQRGWKAVGRLKKENMAWRWIKEMVRERRMNKDYQEDTSRALWWEERVEGKAGMRRGRNFA